MSLTKKELEEELDTTYDQLERLLKSEQLLYNGEIGIGGHHQTAETIRKEMEEDDE